MSGVLRIVEGSGGASSWQRRQRGGLVSLAAALPGALLLDSALSESAHAMCDVIPGVTQEFRGAVGALSRPFAIPNDDGEQIAIRLHPGVCEPSGTVFGDLPGGLVPEDDYFVTLVFEPPGAAARHAVVLATEANLAVCEQRAASAGALPNGGVATCVAAGPDPFGPPLLSIRGECVGGTRSGQRCSDAAECVDADCLPVVLRFRFPDTDALVGAPDDDRTLTGPAAVAVTPVSAPLPVGLASSRCADTSGLVACIDELYARDGTCATGPDHVDPTFGHFTALPPPNDYQGLCLTTPPAGPCEPGRIPPEKRELRFAVDAAGNALVPMDYRGVLVRTDRIPIPRLLVGGTALEAFAGGGSPVQIPVHAFLASYSPGGHRLPPIFEPLHDPQATGELSLFGSVDAPIGVIRVQRQGCVGGTSEGDACTADPDCGAGGSCLMLFDFSDRLVAGVGPAVIPSAGFALATQTPVPLDGLAASQSMFAFVVSEVIAQAASSLNDDGDETDDVVQLRDRATAAVLPIGSNGKPARAVTRIQDGRFRLPALAVEDDLVAFLELEPLEGERDANQNASVFDPILRLYRIRADCGGGAPCAESLLSQSVAVDPNPVVAGRTVAISDGVVYFRAPEWRQATQQTEIVSLSFNGNLPNGYSFRPALSSDGRFVAFSSYASNLVNGPSTPVPQVYLRDRRLATTERISVAADGSAANAPSSLQFTGLSVPEFSVFHDEVAISSDGQVIAFQSLATNLVPGDTNQCYGTSCNDVFVRDRLAGTTERVSVGFLGEQLSDDSVAPTISQDGQVVGFVAHAAQFETLPQSLVHDRGTGVTRLAAPGTSLSFLEPNGNRHYGPSLSADGQIAALVATWQPLPFAAFVYDSRSGSLEQASVGWDGSLSGALGTSVSADGEIVAFNAGRALVPGDTNTCVVPFFDDFTPETCPDVFLRDRRGGTTVRASVASDGGQFDVLSMFPKLSADGQTVAFMLLAPDYSSTVMRHDQRTGATEEIAAYCSSIDGFAISGDGGSVAWACNGVWLSGPSATDLSADLSGDGDLDDAVLGAVDASGPPPRPITWLRPASKVVVAAGAAAFVDDSGRVQLTQRGETPLDLGTDATDLAMSSDILAARVPAPDGGEAFVEVCDWPTRASCWRPTGSRAGTIDAVGNVVALLASECPFTPPPGQPCSGGGVDLNGDGDALDRVVRIYRADTGRLIDTGQAAEDFVLGDRLLAFRTGEASQGVDLDADGDLSDDVLQVFDLVTEQVLNTGNAVTPCPLEACDPRVPYHVNGDTVVYITAEADQGNRDLNGDGDATDLVKQVFNAREAVHNFQAGRSPAESVKAIASASAGIGTTTGQACASDADCGGGSCYLPPGACIVDLGTACTCSGELCGGCPPGQFCEPLSAGSSAGTCKLDEGPCRSQVDCTDSSAICRDANVDIQRLFAPVAGVSGEGDAVTSSGTCVADRGTACAADTDCAAGETCGTGLTCERRAGSCLTDADCSDGLACHPHLVVAAAADTDGDGVLDPLDNCPSVANVDQADLDGDGVGDACDLATCGDGVVSDGEMCDDGNRTSGDGCDASCRLEAPACSDGIDNDGDGRIDFEGYDPGCDSPTDGSERDPSLPCDDGIDNDSDGLTDYPADPVCWGPAAPGSLGGGSPEAAECDDGIDDDGDGGTDWDGSPPDADCSVAWHDDESVIYVPEPSLLLGLGAAMPMLAWLAWRRRRSA